MDDLYQPAEERNDLIFVECLGRTKLPHFRLLDIRRKILKVRNESFFF